MEIKALEIIETSGSLLLFYWQDNAAYNIGYWLGARLVDLLVVGLIVGVIVFFIKRRNKK